MDLPAMSEGGDNLTPQKVQTDNLKQLVRELLHEEPALLTPAVESAVAKATEKMSLPSGKWSIAVV
jgi:hypothetical protein